MYDIVAKCHIKGITPLSHSRQHEDEAKPGESPAAHALRTWRSKINVGTYGGKETVVIPESAMMLAMVAAAQYAKIKIVGQGNTTWTGKFRAGVIISEIPLHIDPATVEKVSLWQNSDGVRGSGKRVIRHFPIIPTWEAKFDAIILDPIVTESIFREILEITGKFVGLGRWRPERLGQNGRFIIESLEFQDNRKMAA